MLALITKKLPSSNLDLLKSNGWEFDVIESLEIIPLKINKPLVADVWILSSRNSLLAIKEFVKQAPAQIYCIGKWAENELKSANVQSRVQSFDSMKSLAADLRNKKFSRLLYFCGDHHREELNQALVGSPSLLTKVTTHESRLTYPILKKIYNAVFVFSPRSAESLLQNNSFTHETIFACIGPTTVSYLHQRGLTNTFSASSPDSETLLREFCEKYKHPSITH
jgi:uroporphyrinogen-III synthase